MLDVLIAILFVIGGALASVVTVMAIAAILLAMVGLYENRNQQWPR